MTRMVLTNVRAFSGAVDLTGFSNKVEINETAEVVEVTNFGSAGSKEFLPGMVSCEVMAAGFWDAGTNQATDLDPGLFAGYGSIVPWSVMPAGAADGALAYLTNTVRATYKNGGAVGDAAGFNVAGRGTTRLARGQVLHPPGTARTASGTGTAFQLGAVSALKRLYANLHVYSVAGTAPSLTARIESDNAVGFPSPITVATFNAATAAASQHLNVAGPTTDDWFRAAWTISGTAPSFLFVVTAGIA